MMWGSQCDLQILLLKSWGGVACACKPSTKGKTAGPWGYLACQPSLIYRFKIMRDPVSKNKADNMY